MIEKKSYYYKAYGFIIKSEIKITEFLEINECIKYDIEIKRTTISDHIKMKIKEGQFGGGDKKEIWFYGVDTAIYKIVNGDTIYFEELEGAEPYYVNIYLTCSSMGFIMYQREKLAIHGGTIVMNGKAIILTGDKGAGKSTLTTALRLKGYKFISDDVASIYINDVPMVNPGFPYQKLCEDAVKIMGYKKEEYFSFMSDREIKYVIPSREDFVEKDTEVYGIFELTVKDIEEVMIEEIKGIEKLKRIQKNIYRGEFFSILGGVSANYFKQCLDVAKSIRYYKITRPHNKITVEEQINIIKEKVFEKNLAKIS